MAIWPFLPSQRKKKEKKKKKKKVEEAATDDEGVIGDCVGNLRATTSTGRRPCFVVFFFFLFFFFFVFFCFFVFEELVFFFSASFFPYKSLCSRSEIVRSPSDLCSSSCSFISCRSDCNFIPVYWPKFIGKAETKRTCPNLKNRSQFIEPGGRTAVCAGPCFFCMERFFTLNTP